MYNLVFIYILSNIFLFAQGFLSVIFLILARLGLASVCCSRSIHKSREIISRTIFNTEICLSKRETEEANKRKHYNKLEIYS